MSNRKLKGGNNNFQFDPKNFNLTDILGMKNSNEAIAKGGKKTVKKPAKKPAKRGGGENDLLVENFNNNQEMEGGKGKKTKATPKPKASPRARATPRGKGKRGGNQPSEQQNNKSAGGEHGAFSDNTYKSASFNNDGGLNVAPFISALALLGTRLLSDKNLMKNNSLNFLNSKKESPKKRSKKSSSSTGGALKGGVVKDKGEGEGEGDILDNENTLEASSNQDIAKIGLETAGLETAGLGTAGTEKTPGNEHFKNVLLGGRKPKASRKPKTPSSPKAKKPKASRK